MPLSQRPSPDEIRAGVVATLTHEELDGCLAIVHADPNWLVQITPAPRSARSACPTTHGASG